MSKTNPAPTTQETAQPTVAAAPAAQTPAQTTAAQAIAVQVERVEAQAKHVLELMEQASEHARLASLARGAAQRCADEVEDHLSAVQQDPGAVTFRQARPRVQFPPVLVDGGRQVALRYNPRQDAEQQDNPEATVPYDGHRDLRTGFRVDVPEGFEAIVTCLGRAGERLVIGHLVGEVRDEYVARVYNLSGGFMTIKAGDECCRLALRRLPQVEVVVLDVDGRDFPSP